MYIIFLNTIRYIADPFDFELSFPCADTYDLINIATGQRTPTWPLTKFALGDDALTFLKQNTTVENTSATLCIYYDEKWGTYHLGKDTHIHDFLKINILKLNNAGKTTKAAAKAE